MKFSCPSCKSKIDIQKTFNMKMHVSCNQCGIEDIIEFSKNIDEVFLEFLTRFDKGLVAKNGLKESLQDNEIIKSDNEIKEMIGDNKLDKIMKDVLFSKKDYISQYKVLENPEPKMGNSIDKLDIDLEISRHLSDLKIKTLYKFQDEAITKIKLGYNVIIEAPTASGKTEAFLIPIIQRIKTESITKNNNVFAIFIYPTKSLARDQYPKIQRFAERIGANVKIFDGDVDNKERIKIIENPPQIIVTNFDILHYHLWHKTRFSTLLYTVKTIVVDEAHVYSGIFGSNVHYIIKRFKRVCKNKIQFIAASATLDDSKNFCQQLFEEDMQLIQGSGKKGKINFVMLFPSLRTQRSMMVELTKKMTEKHHKTMVFNNSHRNSELLAIHARRQKVGIKVHRAGLMPNYRMAVEAQFKNNSLNAISCTPTLELGIDIGNVDCVISSTVPVNRLIQRIGRSARKGQDGYAFLALGNDPISQYYKNHPNDYFEDVEKIYIDPKNPFIEEFQILAMVCDKPISKHELNEHQEVIDKHVINGNFIESSDGKIIPNYTKIKSILNNYSIRGIGNASDILLDGKKVGERVLPIALEELHKDAVYLLAGVRYKVKEFDYPKNNYAKLIKISRDYPYYTKSLTEDWPTIKNYYEKRRANGIEIAFCKLHIQKTVYGYVNMELGQDTLQGEKVNLERPLQYNFITKGIIFRAPRPSMNINDATNEEYVEASGYHATEHVVIEGCNMITGGVSQDLGGISMGNTGLIIIYDGAIGGSGASKALYDRFEKCLKRSRDIVKECPCKNESGCPRCTLSYRCGNNNEYLHKNSALEILERIDNGENTDIIDVPVEGCKPLV